MKILFAYVTKQATLIRRSTVLSLLSPSISIPWLMMTEKVFLDRSLVSIPGQVEGGEGVQDVPLASLTLGPMLYNFYDRNLQVSQSSKSICPWKA